MSKKASFKIGDKVWFMDKNLPMEATIYAIEESAFPDENDPNAVEKWDTEICYMFWNEWDCCPYPDLRRYEGTVYATRYDLRDALFPYEGPAKCKK